MPTKKTGNLWIRLEPELLKRFEQAIDAEAKMHNFERQATSAMVRQMMREYVAKVESVATSEMAHAAAKVLAKAPRANRG